MQLHRHRMYICVTTITFAIFPGQTCSGSSTTPPYQRSTMMAHGRRKKKRKDAFPMPATESTVPRRGPRKVGMLTWTPIQILLWKGQRRLNCLQHPHAANPSQPLLFSVPARRAIPQPEHAWTFQFVPTLSVTPMIRSCQVVTSSQPPRLIPH